MGTRRAKAERADRGSFLTEDRLERRLAADVTGYRRLMGADKEGTLARLKAIRKSLVDSTIAPVKAASSRRPVTAC